jgi:hypothetical protein
LVTAFTGLYLELQRGGKLWDNFEMCSQVTPPGPHPSFPSPEGEWAGFVVRLFGKSELPQLGEVPIAIGRGGGVLNMAPAEN